MQNLPANDLTPPDEDEMRVLRERARVLARRPGAAAGDSAEFNRDIAADIAADIADGERLEVLEFRLAGERYAVETSYVRAVHPLRNLTPLPCTPAFVLGVVNVRGHVLTVIDLKRFFELPQEGLTDLHRIVLVGRDDIEFGILADVSVGIASLRLSQLQPPLPTLTAIGAHYLRGITPDSVAVLDMEAIFSDPRMLVDETP